MFSVLPAVAAAGRALRPCCCSTNKHGVELHNTKHMFGCGYRLLYRDGGRQWDTGTLSRGRGATQVHIPEACHARLRGCAARVQHPCLASLIDTGFRSDVESRTLGLHVNLDIF